MPFVHRLPLKMFDGHAAVRVCVCVSYLFLHSSADEEVLFPCVAASELLQPLSFEVHCAYQQDSSIVIDLTSRDNAVYHPVRCLGNEGVDVLNDASQYNVEGPRFRTLATALPFEKSRFSYCPS